MQPPRLVLLRPRNADNLGAIARAMKNFGLADWCVVSPNPRLLEAPGLNRLAVKSGDLLDNVRLVETLAAAVSDCSWVVGTTMRRVDGRRRLTPRQLSEEQSKRGDGTWALVFGDERSGLTNEDLEQCHELSFIPTADSQPSVNLAQAVLVYAYEFFATPRPTGVAPVAARAGDGALRQVRTALEAALLGAGFLRPESSDRHAIDDLMKPLIRASLTQREARLWNAALRVTTEALKPSSNCASVVPP
jgi:TrmH family RNA methyltransferase